MKITKLAVKYFEAQQNDFGTAIALKNTIWQIASDLMKDIGVTKITTVYEKKTKGQH